jgi:hypothetical protein
MAAEKVENRILVDVLKLAKNGAHASAVLLYFFLGSFKLSGRNISGFTQQLPNLNSACSGLILDGLFNRGASSCNISR